MATAIREEEFPDLSYEADLCGNIEQALKALQGYGIMALELIQNADDAHASTLRLDARDDALVVWNDEEFSRCGLERSVCDWSSGTVEAANGRRSCNFHAITRMGGRSKMGSEDQIGRFGIGFVSVYQVTDTPTVSSVGVEYTLNPREGRARRRSVVPTGGTEFILPWAFRDSPVRRAIHQNVVPLDVADKVVEAVAAILSGSVLFLRHLERIEVLRAGVLRASVDISRTADGVDLLIGPGDVVQRWIVQSRDAEDIVQARKLRERFTGLAELKRSTTVSVAAPIDAMVDDGLLYAYLPTRKSTGLPLHVNADFFPHASRQEIVLGSESQESFWNEAMLAAAAEIVGERFELLKTTLGHRRLWRLGEASRQLSTKDPAFASFWEVFSSKARECESVWVLGGGWRKPVSVRSAPLSVGEPEQAGLASFGLSMLDPSLREHLNALSATGVAQLRVIDVAAALQAGGTEGIAAGNPNLRLLWSALNGMLEPPRGALASVVAASAASLADVPFLLDWAGAPVSPAGAWRLPDNVPAELLEEVASDLPVVNPDLLGFPNLLKQVDRFGLDALAELLAGLIPDEAEAVRRLGTSDRLQRTVYRLLVLLWDPQQETAARDILWNVPFLRKADGRFTTPARALLPGEFRDPTGWFEFPDVGLFPPGMSNFAEEVLGVYVMGFPEFVSDHLADAIRREPTRDQYRALLTEIIDHRHQLEDVLDDLKQVSFVRNRAGQFVRPVDCYFFDAEIQAVLGEDPARWVDHAWLPADPDRQKRLRDFLESKRLGMPTHVAAEHIVERIEEIAETGDPEAARRQLGRIFRHVLDRWGRLDDDYREQFEALSDVAFVPVQLDGQPDGETLYRPDEVFRAGRAAGFSTQAPVIDVAPLRANTRHVNELLELLGVEELPDTSVVVDHLIACMEADRDPHPLTYQILGERCDQGRGLEQIDRLQGTSCIYHPSHGYLRPSTVFWSDPPIPRHWHRAHEKMSDRPTLFSRLGVAAAPGPANYAELALALAASPDPDREAGVHGRCMRYLADALWNGFDGAAEAVEALKLEDSLLSAAGAPLWPGDAFWVDSEQHIAPFRRDLDDIIVLPPAECDVAALRKFYARLRTRTLSEHVRLELAREPGGAVEPEATDTLRERSDLLLRLAPTGEARAELRRLLEGVTVWLAPSLLSRAELRHDEVIIGSDAVEADAFIDGSRQVIFLGGERVKWVVLARHVFDSLARLCPTSDMRSLAGTAAMVLQAPSLEEARELLDELHYAEHVGEDDVWADSSSSPDADDWWSEADAQEEPADDLAEDGAQDGDLDDEEPEFGSSRGREGQGSATDGGPEAGGTAGTAGAGSNPSGDPTAGSGSGGDADDPYKSRSGGAGIGDDPAEKAGSGGGVEGGAAGGGGQRTGAETEQTNREGRDAKSRAERSERRKKRQSRYSTYVASDDYETLERSADDDGEEEADDRTEEIGKAAVAAVLSYERFHGREPEEMPHHNPGYDVISTNTGGGRRLIEVKGMDGEWGPAGVKLSRRQFRFAQEHPDEFWLYAVEHALDPQKRLVRPLRNPFARVDSFFFDSEWRKATEAVASSAEMLVRVGAKVDDWRWGVGVIVELTGRGIGRQAKVRFPIDGLKLIPVHKLNIVD